jgi:hypothetical protein
MRGRMKNFLSLIITNLVMIIGLSGTAIAYDSLGEKVNQFCPDQPYSGDCSLCHEGSKGDDTAAKDAYNKDDLCFFCETDPICQPVVQCTDADADGFASEGGDCGPVDCNDADANVNPNAVESCTDGVDNNCSGLIDAQDPQAVNCPPVCTDNDFDGYFTEGGECGPIDCDDTKANINPGADESCTDAVDNNCNGLVDEQDPNALNCPLVCVDQDSDGYAVTGGECGIVDCNDLDETIHPGALENCNDNVDNNCNNLIDIQETSCIPPPPVDVDGDGVFDNIDQCPGTAPGVEVDADGCEIVPVDTDNDGVFDDTDLCPNTTSGVEVDINGCEVIVVPPPVIDTDNDGVADIDDACPDTSVGAEVDASGCAVVVEPPPVVEPPVDTTRVEELKAKIAEKEALIEVLKDRKEGASEMKKHRLERRIKRLKNRIELWENKIEDLTGEEYEAPGDDHDGDHDGDDHDGDDHDGSIDDCEEGKVWRDNECRDPLKTEEKASYQSGDSLMSGDRGFEEPAPTESSWFWPYGKTNPDDKN